MKKIIAVLLIIIFISGCTNSNNVVIDKETAQCIASKSKLYISTGCVDCAKQREILGNGYQYMDIIDCKIQPTECNNVNIVSVPTWIINYNQIRGAQSIEELKELTGC